MLLKRLKSNQSANLFFIPVAVIAFWMKSILNPFTCDLLVGEEASVLFAPIFNLIGNRPLLHVVLSALLVIGLAFLIQLINDRYSFIRIRSKLPGLLFVIVLGGFTEMHTLHPIYFGLFFVLFAILRLFSIFEKSKPYSAVFDAGLLLGISTLFYFNLIILFPAFLIGGALLSREWRWRSYVIFLLGLVLPFVFTFAYAALIEQFTEMFNGFKKSILSPANNFSLSKSWLLYLAVLVLYTLIASFDILKQYDKKKIASRKYFTVFFWIFIFSLISFLFIPGSSHEILIISAFPVTFLISNLFVFMRSRFWGELLFAVFLLTVIILQFTQGLV